MNTTITTDSFRLIVREYQQRVYHVIRKIVIDHDDTDDLVQEVFVKVWEKRDSFNGESQLFTWIYRIAVNEALQFLRKKKKMSLAPDDDNKVVESYLRAHMSPDADEILVKLQNAIGQLPEKQRTVFLLKYYDELSYEQISDILGGSIGGLKANYHHAVKKIEEFLVND